jgi:NAD(P)-dependent dehydrogenase (short-subunit alcohol dehydrogenase family)
MLFPSTELILQKLTRKSPLLSTGIGYSTVKHLANRGAKVYLGSRTETKGKEAAEKLKGEGIGNGDVLFLPCDLGSPASAKKAAEDFLQLETRLDILGMLSSPVFLNNAKIEQCQSITQHGT